MASNYYLFFLDTGTIKFVHRIMCLMSIVNRKEAINSNNSYGKTRRKSESLDPRSRNMVISAPSLLLDIHHLQIELILALTCRSVASIKLRIVRDLDNLSISARRRLKRETPSLKNQATHKVERKKCLIYKNQFVFKSVYLFVKDKYYLSIVISV